MFSPFKIKFCLDTYLVNAKPIIFGCIKHLKSTPLMRQSEGQFLALDFS